MTNMYRRLFLFDHREPSCKNSNREPSSHLLHIRLQFWMILIRIIIKMSWGLDTDDGSEDNVIVLPKRY
jgi:hypothetical protein